MRRTFLVLAAAALGPLLFAVSSPARSERIAGGTPATEPWPAQAHVRVPAGACGGSLVSARFVLTAAHCVTQPDGSIANAGGVSLILGRNDLTTATPSDFYGVAAGGVIRHESFGHDAPLANDLALLRLDRPTTLEPIRLVTDSESGLWAPGTTATILGWGRTCYEVCPPVSRLRQAGVQIVDDATCAARYAAFAGRFSAATMVCAGTGVSDACQGDSGGPLMVPRLDVFVLAAVTSWGEDCGNPSYPGVYARLGAPALNQWVRDRIPTVTMAASPAVPEPGSDVVLRASAQHPSGLPPTPEWDLDGDLAYDDAFGSTATLQDIPAGSHVVRVRASFVDGDRAYAREVITTAGSAPPPPPPPPAPPPLPKSAAPPPPAPPPDVLDPVPVPDPPAARRRSLAGLVFAPLRVRLRSVRDRRIVVRVRCSAACAIEARLTLDARSSRRVRLTRRRGVSATLGRGAAVRRRPASFKVTIRLTPRAWRALRRLPRATLRLQVSADGAAGSERLTRSIAYRR